MPRRQREEEAEVESNKKAAVEGVAAGLVATGKVVVFIGDRSGLVQAIDAGGQQPDTVFTIQACIRNSYLRRRQRNVAFKPSGN